MSKKEFNTLEEVVEENKEKSVINEKKKKIDLSKYLTDERKKKAVSLLEQAKYKSIETVKDVKDATIKEVRSEEFRRGLWKFFKSVGIGLFLFFTFPVMAYIYIVLSVCTAKSIFNVESLIKIGIPAILFLWYIKVDGYSEDKQLILSTLLLVIAILYAINIYQYGNIWSIRYAIKRKILNPFVLFCQFPLSSGIKDKELKKYLIDDRKIYITEIQTDSIDEDKVYGNVRFGNFKNISQDIKANQLSDTLITEYSLIPFSVGDEVFLLKNGHFKQSLDKLMGFKTENELLELIENDNTVNHGFPALKEKLKIRAAELKEEADKQREQEELAQLEQQIQEKGLGQDVATILKKIRDKRDEWNFGVWNGNDNMAGNSSYFKIRCILRNGKTLKNIKEIKQVIESEFRHSIILNERQDKRAFDLTVILKAQLDSFNMKVEDLKEYSKNKLLYLGKSYTGDLVCEWNYQANHVIFAGKSGSGKSEAIRKFLTQLAWLDDGGDDFDYKTMFLTSSSKIGDFADFGKMGALVKAGIDNQIQVFSFILKMLEEREEIFYKNSVQNIKQFNEKYPEKRMKQLVLLADEYENTRGDLDKKKAFEAESLMVSILNIARSSGCIVIIGAQSILNKDVGTVIDKMTIRFSGKNESNVLSKIDASIASFYKSYKGKPQGTFFFQTDNLEISGDYITQADTSFTLIQTAYISDISPRTLPKLAGAEFEEEIFSKNILEENKEEEKIGVDLF